MDSRRKGAALTLVAAGGLAVLGSMLPWIKVTSGFGNVTASGMDGGDGIITLVIGIAVGLVGIATITSAELPKLVSSSPVVGALVVGAVTVINHIDVNDRVSAANAEAGGFASATVGAGIWALYIGAVLMLIGGISLGKSSATADKSLTSGSTMRECPHCKEAMRRDASVCPHCQRDSEAWQLHEGLWWKNEDGDSYWLDEKTGSWVKHEVSTAAETEGS